MHLRFAYFLLIAILVFLNRSQAGLFKIINRNYGSAGAYQSIIDPVFDTLEAAVNAPLPVADNSNFMRSMANSGALSGAVNSANYGPSILYAQAGAAFGVGVGATTLSSSSFNLNSVGGFGAQGVLLLGTRLNIFGTQLWGLDLNKAWGYFGIFKYNLSQSNATFDYLALSMYLQYRLYDAIHCASGAFKWHGLFVGTGLRYLAQKATFTQAITETTTQAVTGIPGTTSVTATYNGTLTGGADISVISIPLEVSTSVGGLWIFHPYLGLGADLNFGVSKSIANAVGPLTITENSGTYGTWGGTGTLDLGDQAAPSLLGIRAFYGLQFDVGIAAFNFGMTRNFSTKEVAYNIGLKGYW